MAGLTLRIWRPVTWPRWIDGERCGYMPPRAIGGGIAVHEPWLLQVRLAQLTSELHLPILIPEISYSGPG